MKNKIIIGSRGSKLALIYAQRAKTILLTKKHIKNIEIKAITTTGDTIKDIRLSEHGGKGLFCKTIEKELLNKKIDIAVHALKDMPTEETDGLITCCFLERNNPREVLISNKHKNIKDLKHNAIVGTSSFRREYQIKRIRDDLNCKLIRGKVIRHLPDRLMQSLFRLFGYADSLSNLTHAIRQPRIRNTDAGDSGLKRLDHNSRKPCPIL